MCPVRVRTVAWEENVGLGGCSELNLPVASAEMCFGQGAEGESLAPGHTRGAVSHCSPLVFIPHPQGETQNNTLVGKGAVEHRWEE